MSYDIQQSTTAYELLFLLVLSSDHISPATGKTPTVTIRKPSGAFGSPAGAVSEIANGWYTVAGNATDTNTLGPLLLSATEASSDPTAMVYNVVAYNPQVATNLGLSALPTASPNAAGGIITFGAGAGQLNVDGSGNVPLSATTENAIADALLDRSNGIETGVTPRQAIRYGAAAITGVLAGAATTSITIAAIGNSGTNRITATVDASGNRTAVVLA